MEKEKGWWLNEGTDYGLSYAGIHRDIAGYSFLGEIGVLGHIGHCE